MSLRLLLGLVCLGSLVFLARMPARFGLGVTRARAEQSPYLGRENPLLGLLPSASALSARERARLEQAMVQALGRLQHVQRAEVLISQREPSTTSLELAAPDQHVEVRLALSAPGPSELEVERVVRRILPALAPGKLHLKTRINPTVQLPAPALTRVGPFMVARESSAALRGTLALCLGANVLLASLLLVRGRRTR